MTNDVRLRLGQLLNSFLPDWTSLERQAIDAKQQQAPSEMAHWTPLAALNSKSRLVKGLRCDVWLIPDGICLYKKPGLLERLLGALSAMIAAALMPLWKLWRGFEQQLQQFILRLGPLAFIITLPFALIGLVWDFCTVWLGGLLLLLLNPIALVGYVLTFPLWLVRTLLARAFSMLLSGWMDRMTASLERLAAALVARRWMRGIMLGFLRRGRPAYPIIIPRDSVSQVILTSKWSLVGKVDYLAIIEGDALEAGLTSRISSLFKRIFLPFYWERTIHVLGAIKRAGHNFQVITAALNQQGLSWEDRFIAPTTRWRAGSPSSTASINTDSIQVSADSAIGSTSTATIPGSSPHPFSSPLDDETLAPVVEINAPIRTESTSILQPANSFKLKTFLILVVSTVVVCGPVLLHKSLIDKTRLLFAFSLDGKPLSAIQTPVVTVDGKPFTAGSRISLLRHIIRVELENVEFLERHFWTFYGAKNLGMLPLESTKGSLAVTVNPSPATFVLKRNGEIAHRGNAPQTIEKLPIGEYTLTAERGEYMETHSLKIERQHRTEANIDLNLGGLDLSCVQSDASFELSSGARSWPGSLPKHFDDLPTGTYRLSVRRKDWELTDQIVVNRGKTTTNRIDFPYASIEVVSEPSGLVVSSNGEDIGKTPLTFGELKPGNHSIRITDHEDNELKWDVTLEPKQVAKHSFAFRYGSVRLSSMPSGASVIRNGKELGQTPLTLPRFVVGGTELSLNLAGYSSTNITVVVGEKEAIDLNTKLISERYLEAMKQARTAFDSGDFTESKKFIVTALDSEPNDALAIRLRDDVFQAEKKAEEIRRETEQKVKRAEFEAKQLQNSLGMKFVRIGDVLFSVWETRVQDFEAFVRATNYKVIGEMISFTSMGPVASQFDNKGFNWRNPGFAQTGKHPVVGVSWDDSMAFCKWLTQKERAEGRILASQSYRLPNRGEWMKAIGGDAYPWGDAWPPPNGSGNFAGEEFDNSYRIRGYRDGFLRTAPVGSFRANRYGVYDLAGNVHEWCNDIDTSRRGWVFVHGSAWFESSPDRLKSSEYGSSRKSLRSDDLGFRVVLVDKALP